MVRTVGAFSLVSAVLLAGLVSSSAASPAPVASTPPSGDAVLVMDLRAVDIAASPGPG